MAFETPNASACTVKRRGEAEQSRTFSDDDAAKAGLKGKAGPWTQDPKRMRQMRARAFALRDVFPDVLRGLPVAEELMDAPPVERHMGAADEVKPETGRPALPDYSMADFERNFPAWQKLVTTGKKTAPELLAMLSTKAAFSEDQKASILVLKAAPEPAPAPRNDSFVDDMNAAEAAA